jgi:Na+-driven multidrug efflux pump
MKKPGWFKKLQERWNVSATQVVLILIVFACTGFTVMFLKKPLLSLLGADDSIWATVAYYVLILPLYNAILLVYGFIFGQFRFFLDFEKRFFSRIFGRAKDEN